MDSPRSCKKDKFFRLILCIPYLFTTCFTKMAWRWEFLGVLVFSFDSHKNFNRPEKDICLSLQATSYSAHLQWSCPCESKSLTEQFTTYINVIQYMNMSLACIHPRTSVVLSNLIVCFRFFEVCENFSTR